MVFNWLKAIRDWAGIHSKDIPQAKYKIGGTVFNSLDEEVEIIGVNISEDGKIEYALDGYTYLHYEEELEKK